jgi:hypothetical protein
LKIINSTIADNLGIGVINNNILASHNNIIFGNIKNEYEYDIYSENNNIYISNNLIGTSSIDLNENNNLIGEDPLFFDAENGDYSLQEESPAIDKGNNVHLPTQITTDLFGYLRISNSTVDIGAHEYQQEPISKVAVNTVNTGVSIYTQNRTVIIENTTEPVSIYSIGGQCVAQGVGAGSYVVPQVGVYIVRTGSEANIR